MNNIGFCHQTVKQPTGILADVEGDVTVCVMMCHPVVMFSLITVFMMIQFFSELCLNQNRHYDFAVVYVWYVISFTSPQWI